MKNKKNHLARIFIISSVLSMLVSCSVQKSTLDYGVKKISQDELSNKLNSFNRAGDMVILKNSKISIEEKSIITNLKANFIIVRDSAILVSVSNPLGIEISRAILLPDSIKVLDRLNKTYIEAKYTELERKFSVALDFYQIQSIITGDYKYALTKSGNSLNTNELVSEGGFFKVIIPYNIENNNRTEMVLLVDQNTFYIWKTSILIEGKKQEYEIEYSDYIKSENYQFPGFLEITYKQYRTVIRIAIQNKNIRFEKSKPIEIEVPSNYERKRAV